MAVKRFVVSTVDLSWRREMRRAGRYARRVTKGVLDPSVLKRLDFEIGVDQILHTRIIKILYHANSEFRNMLKTEFADEVEEMKLQMRQLRLRIMIAESASRIIRNRIRRATFPNVCIDPIFT